MYQCSEHRFLGPVAGHGRPPLREPIQIHNNVREMPSFELIAPSATHEEAAAVVAALERFMRATAPPPAQAGETRDPWHEAALRDGVARLDLDDGRDPWINA